MKERLQSITGRLNAIAAVLVILVIWQAVSSLGIVPGYMLPSPIQVLQAFIQEFPLLMENSGVTLTEAFIGLLRRCVWFCYGGSYGSF